MAEFAIGEEPLGNGIIMVQVSGFLDAHTFEELEDAIQRKFTEGAFKLVVDFERGRGRLYLGALGEPGERRRRHSAQPHEERDAGL